MSQHIASDELRAFLRGALPPHRVLGVADHLQQCATCSMTARRSESTTRAAAGLVSELASVDEEHPSVETTLTAFVDGTLSRGEMVEVEEHLVGCARCAEDVEDLRATARALTHRPRRTWLPAAIAAAAILALIATLLLLKPAPTPSVQPSVVRTTTTPPPTTTTPPLKTYERAEWRAAVDDALRTGALQMPAVLADLQLAPDVLRTGSIDATGSLSPVRTIVETARPQFTWTPVRGATYVVSVFENETLIAQSDELSEPRWKPTRDLPRGRTIQWEVRVRTGDERRTLPAPPAPPALFRVLDASAFAELQNARARHAGDPLLLGVLYARYGLREDAERELRRVPPKVGAPLLLSVEQWPR